MNLENKLKGLSANSTSNWVDEAAKSAAAENARRKSRRVALTVLAALKEKHMSQSDLAAKMGVSRQQVTKIVKGQENLSFETVAKLEKALGIEIVVVKEFAVKKTAELDIVIAIGHTSQTQMVVPTSADVAGSISDYIGFRSRQSCTDNLLRRYQSSLVRTVCSLQRIGRPGILEDLNIRKGVTTARTGPDVIEYVDVRQMKFRLLENS